MKAEAFSRPIFVKRGKYIVQEIASLADAVDFLEEWPENQRNLMHEAALKVCYDAYDGRKPISAARDAFCGFARRVGILEDQTSAMQWIAACKSAK